MNADPSSLATVIERLHTAGAAADRDEARSAFATLRAELSSGRIRSAIPDPSSTTGWSVNTWVKQGILLGFRLGSVVNFSVNEHFQYSDKETYPLKDLRTAPSGIRLVPGGSSVRRGAYLGPRVTLMPPM